MLRTSTLTILAALACGCSSRDVPLNDDPGTGGTGGAGSGGSGGTGITQRSSDVDLLLVVDNSISMADKQAVLSSSIAELVLRVINPRCVDAAGKAVAQPASSTAACPPNSNREHPPAESLNVGVITTSLGSRGTMGVCSGAGEGLDDRAHLLGTVRTVQSSNAHGYLEWPAGAADPQAFVDQVNSHIGAVGEMGCGFESPLEAMYRFLISPDPPESIVQENGFTFPVGLDTTLIDQRNAFLRPGSTLAVLILTDENDCSIVEADQGGLLTLQGEGGLPKGTAACEIDPDSEACTFNPNTNIPAEEDPLNLRCWDQKRRYGVDFLYPVERYVKGLSSPSVPNRDGNSVPNPLFAVVGGKQRAVDQVVVAGLVGVPWQRLARPGTDAPGVPLGLLTASELHAQGVWSQITGTHTVPPTDPHMLESPFARGSLATASTPMADPTHGHEWDIKAASSGVPADLQYACILELPEPRDCAITSGGCDCKALPPHSGVTGQNPLCFNPNGNMFTTVQRYAKAYPGRRQLDLLRALGDRAAVGSVCPKTLKGSPRDVGYGYNPLFENLIARVSLSIE